MPYDSNSFGGQLFTKPVAPIAPTAPPDVPSAPAPAGNLLGSGALGGTDFRDLITNTPLKPASPGVGGVAATPPPAQNPNPAPGQGANAFDADPGVAMARALENQGIGSLDAWLKAAREQAIIAAGDPALAGMAGFGLDPQAGVFAQQNYLSGNADLARVKRAKDLAHQAIINKLAAHGIIASGDLGYLEGQSNIDFGNQEYDVRQGVLKRLSDFMQQYLDRKSALKQSTLAAYQQAYQNMAANPPTNYGGVTGGEAGSYMPSDKRMAAIVNLLRSR